MPELRYFDAPPETRAAIRARIREVLAERPENRLAYLLGSFAEARPFRDIDIAVYLEPAFLHSVDPLRYCFQLADTLERVVGYPVDVHRLNDAPCGFRFSATCGQLLISRDEAFRLAWTERTWHEYAEFDPYRRMYLRELLRPFREKHQRGAGITDAIPAQRTNLQCVRETLQQADDATLLSDPVRMAALKWHLLLALEDAFALCNLALATLGGEPPTAYAECFKRLAAHNILRSELSNRLRAMTRFRNLLLHRYWEVDDQRVLQIARHELGDLEEFVGALAAHFNLGA